MQKYMATFSSRGRITIPKKLRSVWKLDKDRRAIVRLQGNTIVIKPIIGDRDFKKMEKPTER